MGGALPEREPRAAGSRLRWEQPLAYLWLALAALGWLVYFAVTLSIPPAEGAPFAQQLLAQLAALLVGVVALMAVLLAGEKPRWPASGRWALFIGGTAVVLLAYLANVREPVWRGLLALGVLAMALPVGYWVGDRMEKITNLIPVAVAFTFADIFSVFQGPSKRVVEELTDYEQELELAMSEAAANLPPELAAAAAAQAAAAVRAPLVDYVVVHLPLPGTGASAGVLGIGDFVILALLFRAAWVHGISPLSVLLSALVSIVAAVAASQLIGQALPALPFIAVGVIGWLLLTNPRLRRLDRQEIVLSILVAALFIALMAGRWAVALV